MKNVVFCRLCICAGRAIYSDLTNVYRGPFAVIWSDLMERRTAWEKAWKPITPIKLCSVRNYECLQSIRLLLSICLVMKVRLCCPPTGLRNLLEQRSSLHSSWTCTSFCLKFIQYFFSLFPPVNLQDGSWTSCGKIVNLMKWLQFFMQNHTVNVVPGAYFNSNKTVQHDLFLCFL